jgi:hypothetical protein
MSRSFPIVITPSETDPSGPGAGVSCERGISQLLLDRGLHVLPSMVAITPKYMSLVTLE